MARKWKGAYAKPSDPIYSRGFVVGVPGQKASPGDTQESKQRSQGALHHQYPWLDEAEPLEHQGVCAQCGAYISLNRRGGHPCHEDQGLTIRHVCPECAGEVGEIGDVRLCVHYRRRTPI